MVMRGGTSKGLYFLESDLPTDQDQRDKLLLAFMGSPDARQIDGMGGAHPLTSKVAVVSPCDHGVGDVDYLFLQLGVDEPIVTDRQNCGNLLAGIGPFAVERGLVPAGTGPTRVSIHMLNTDSVAISGFECRERNARVCRRDRYLGCPGHGSPDHHRLRGARRREHRQLAADRQRRR